MSRTIVLDTPEQIQMARLLTLRQRAAPCGRQQTERSRLPRRNDMNTLTRITLLVYAVAIVVLALDMFVWRP